MCILVRLKTEGLAMSPAEPGSKLGTLSTRCSDNSSVRLQCGQLAVPALNAV